MNYLVELKENFKGEVETSEKVLEKYSEDTSIFKIIPKAVVFPKDIDDLKKIILSAKKYKGQISLTARSAGTDMSGGPLTNSVVVDFLRYFNHIIYVDPQKAITEPGVFYRDFEPKTLAHGSLLPSYTASRELNTVGGMVANNSAGEKSLTYGKTERYVKKLKVVLSDGNEYEFQKLSRQEWEEKKQLESFEGDIYRKISTLIENNKDLINQQKPIVNKNSAGYGIWNVYNQTEDTFDLTQLFVGSQGTLGLISEITFSLIPVRNESRMLVIFLRDKHFKELGQIVNTILQFEPESFESYDDKTFDVMLKVFPKLFKKLGGNPFKLVKDFWPEIKMIFTGGVPKLVLMAEFTGFTEEEVVKAVRRAENKIKKAYDLPTHITATKAEADKYWTIRRESFKLLRENVKDKHTAPFIDDMSVKPEYLPEFLPELYKILDEYDLTYTVAGHVGDGNFHIIPLMDFSRPDFVNIIKELSDRVYTLVAKYHGSTTGEHNDGLIRTPYLYKIFSPEMLDIFNEIKNIFDPYKLFNPHKKVDPDMDLLVSSIKKGYK
ncbi:MAG: FAD-binding oxidoreductase [Candidatus Paceibacterota bacterium]